MLEGFKINCYPLNRSIRVTIHLPKDYNNTRRYYPVIYILDGQNAFKDEDSYRGSSLGFEEIIEILSLEGKDAIYVGIAAASNPEKREQEYQNTTLSNFIVSSIHPYLTTRYRMNSYVYVLGCSTAAFTALSLAKQELFKGAILISPIVKLEEIEEIEKLNQKLLYIYAGDKELNGECKKIALELKCILKDANYCFDDNALHQEQAWKKKILEALNYLVLQM